MENKNNEELIKQKEETDKFLLKLEIVLISVGLINMLAMYCFAAYVLETFNIVVLPISMMVLSLVMLLIVCFFALKIEQKAGYYKCEKCGNKYVPMYKQVLCSIHIGRTRFMKCPHCKEKSWNKKVIK